MCIRDSPSPPPKEAPAEVAVAQTAANTEAASEKSSAGSTIAVLVAAVMFGLVGSYAPAEFVQHFTVFVLACFIGWQVVWNVTPALHTPLMGVTNAISGIIVIGALLLVGSGSGTVTVLSAVAILIATINVAGGFLVTQRMLKMFRK